MALTGNKGEWSEIYTLFKLLGDGKVHAGDADMNKLELYYPILNIIREESKRYEYKPNTEQNIVVIDEDGNEYARISMDKFVEESTKLLSEIKAAKKSAFEIPEAEQFMGEIGCSKLKAPSTDKADIHIVIHDLRTNMTPLLGFSIKSQLGSASTLLNAGATTNITYKADGMMLSDEDIDAINKQLRHYYIIAMNNIIKEFEAVYDKVLAQAEEGKPMTPAWLYQLDRYYQMQAQLRDTLQKLGDRTCEVLSEKFGQEYKHIYSALAIDSEGKAVKASISNKAFSTIDEQVAKQVASQVWCADGKTWSQRVWDNINDLQQTLNDGLIDCVVTGKKTTELKKQLMERFNVSYGRAETLVRTEMAHVETQAALDRYKSSGTQKIRIVVDPDERTCDVCAKWDDKIVDISEVNAGTNCPPFHPRCRCAIAAVVEKKKNNKE